MDHDNNREVRVPKDAGSGGRSPASMLLAYPASRGSQEMLRHPEGGDRTRPRLTD